MYANNTAMDFEQSIINAVQKNLAEAIEKTLTGYNTPLAKLINSVIESREQQFRTMLEEVIDQALIGDFREHLKDALTMKLAKCVISKMEGEVEKRVNDLRSSPETRAKITLAVSEALKSIVS